MAAQWCAVFQAHKIQETLNRRETLPTLPSRYPYKGSWKRMHTPQKKSQMWFLKKKQAISLTHPPRNGH